MTVAIWMGISPEIVCAAVVAAAEALAADEAVGISSQACEDAARRVLSASAPGGPTSPAVDRVVKEAIQRDFDNAALDHFWGCVFDDLDEEFFYKPPFSEVLSALSNSIGYWTVRLSLESERAG